MKDQAVSQTPLQPGFISRALAGVKYAVTGKAPDWFGPLEPLEPVAPPETAGRAWDYPVGVNVQYQPRSGETITFQQMRGLADSYDLLRLVIETRKDQLVKMDWQIKAKDGSAGNDAAIKEIEAFLAFPDRFHSWQQWLRIILEDMLVIDATTIYPRRTVGGGIYSLDPVDGATIKVLIDQAGRMPEPPDPAYQQILKGIVATEYSRNEIIYSPRNPRSNKFYGMSPVEQIIMSVNIALRRQLFTLNYYTDGNIPEALISVPPEWNPDQIRMFQEYWDALLAGNLADRRKVKFIPGGMQPHFTKEPLLKDEMDEWLARIVCYAFSVPPTPFVKQMNRATAATVQEAALNEGLIPLLVWVKDLIDEIIVKHFGYPELEFAWQMAEEVDPLTRAQVAEIYVRNGIKSVDEIREEMGLEPVGLGNAVYGAQGVTLLEDILNPPEPPTIQPQLPPPMGNNNEVQGASPPPEGGQEAAQKAFMASTLSKAYRLGLL